MSVSFKVRGHIVLRRVFIKIIRYYLFIYSSIHLFITIHLIHNMRPCELPMKRVHMNAHLIKRSQNLSLWNVRARANFCCARIFFCSYSARSTPILFHSHPIPNTTFFIALGCETELKPIILSTSSPA